jgi:hypothetical protein
MVLSAAEDGSGGMGALLDMLTKALFALEFYQSCWTSLAVQARLSFSSAIVFMPSYYC